MNEKVCYLSEVWLRVLHVSMTTSNVKTGIYSLPHSTWGSE